jgi:ankyrin repeat protein
MEKSINYKLLKAIEIGNERDVEYCLNNGADPNICNKNGITALSLACSFSFKRNIIPLLIDAGADINATSQNGTTALHTASDRGLIDSSIYLLEAGADTNLTTNNGDTPLLLAAKVGSPYLVDLFCMSGVNLNHQNKYKRTALIDAIINDKIPVALSLINNKCNINICDIFGCSAIMYAADLGRFTLVRLLISQDLYDHKLLYAIASNRDIADDVKKTLYNISKDVECYLNTLPRDIIGLIYPLIVGDDT